MSVGKTLGLIFLGMLVAVAIFCIVVAICANVNSLNFFEQITEWFGSGSKIADDVVKPVSAGVTSLRETFSC